MKRFFQSFALAVFVMFSASFSCAQNGPTLPSVQLSWAQSTATGVTANCVYRGTASKTYTIPALFCSTAPIVSYTDLTVARGTTYYYAVTAQVNKAESGYSNEAVAPVPSLPPPTGNGSQETKLKLPPIKDGDPGHLVADVMWDNAGN